jgi:hypothetical protein
MAVYEALLLNTAVPQIQAAQTGDSYVMVVNATTPALRITQTGTGDSILVEDAANPDSSPFVVSAAGDVGIGTNAPPTKLYVTASVSSTAIAAFFNTDTANGNGVYIKAGGANAGKYALAVDNAASASLLYLDSYGNLGLGVTPSVAYGKEFTFNSVTSTAGAGVKDLAVNNGNSYYAFNALNSGAFTWNYHNSQAAVLYQQNGGGTPSHVWSIAPSGTAGNAISFTQALTLTANRNLLVGITSENSGNGGLKVAGQFALTTSQAFTTSGSVNDTAYYIVCYSLSGTCTLTLPTPANNTGRLLNIVVQSAQQVVSASSNVAKITDGTLTTDILPATAGKWAQLWCDGTYWNIIATNV